MKYQIMYNPLSCNGKGKEESAVLSEILKGNELVWNDVTAITDYDGFLDKLPDGDILLISGGDGTLSRFVNILGDRTLTNRIDYFATGTGNDFMHDLGVEKGKIAEDIGKYLTGLPKVTVKGKTYRFFNGVGYGIDGYCCEVGDKMRAEGKTDINYAGIAIKGVLFNFKPIDADVTIDGVTTHYKKVWLAPAMKGRYYGGGMMPTPDQDRNDPEKNVSVCVWWGSSKLKTLIVFSSIFKGEHLKHPEMCRAFKGRKIHVKFAKPCALQFDGETILGVEEYTVEA